MTPRPIVPTLLCALVLVIGSARPAAAQPVAAQHVSSDGARASSRAALERDVRHLASDSLRGRHSGTIGGALAAQYIADAFDKARLEPAVRTDKCDAPGDCEWSYFQHFPTRFKAHDEIVDLPLNVVATIAGTDGALKDQWIVIGAHFDALGFSIYSTWKGVPAVHPGADDNASGTAAVIELARRLSAAPLRRPVMFVLFAEGEQGRGGSKAFIERLTQPMDSLVAMFNLDMIGRLEGRELDLYGTSTSRSWKALIDSATTRSRLRTQTHSVLHLKAKWSDHITFAERGVPVLHLYTGMHKDRYSTRDIADRVDYDGLVRVVDYAEQLIRLTGDGPRPWRER